MTIHRRATKWTHGPIPETLLAMCREHAHRATSWHALVRAGKAGYRHVGLEVEVSDLGSAVADEIAGAVMTMVKDHAQAHGSTLFRVDALDENNDRLGDCLVRFGDDGEPEDVPDAAGGNARWAIKALNDTHTRYLSLLDTIQGMTEMVKASLDAMAGAVATVVEVKLSHADAQADDAQEQRRHDKQMKFIEWLMAERAASKRGGDTPPGSTLGDVLASMPEDVRTVVVEGLGEQVWLRIVAASRVSDREERRRALFEILAGLSAEQRATFGKLPDEWRSKLETALRGEGFS